MPNWNQNTLTIEGPSEIIDEFMAKAKYGEQLISLNRLYPRPAELDIICTTVREEDNDEESNKLREAQKSNIEKYGVADWYMWNVNNWGTKWNLGDIFICSEEPTKRVYQFDTAWSPPTAAFLHISEDFPKLKFTLEYQEGGMGFEGTYTCQNGKILMNDCHDYTPEYDEDDPEAGMRDDDGKPILADNALGETEDDTEEKKEAPSE